jgi:hypothetical protein
VAHPNAANDEYRHVRLTAASCPRDTQTQAV